MNCATTSQEDKDFNSKLVRLKVGNVPAMWGRPGLFQFQTGAIRSEYDSSQTYHFYKFQFQTGSIRRNVAFRHRSGIDGFNSKLVRLEGNF